MNITLKYVNPAKDGKRYGSIVGTDDTKLMVKADMVGRFVKGQTYDVSTRSETWGDSDVQVVTGLKGAGAEKPSYAPQGNGGMPWWMPFVSNQCAHAITAGCIKDPMDIKAWAAAAKQAAIELDD